MGLFGKDKKDQPAADFSDVQSGGSSTAPTRDAEKTSAPSTGTGRIYIVVSGDSLSKISKREYGDANQWPKIYEANRDTIKNPDLIYPGQKLRIP